MKRWIHFSENTSMTEKEYCSWVINLLKSSDMKDVVNFRKINIQDYDDTPINGSEILVTLVDPYKCKYYSRVKSFEDQIMLVSTQDDIGHGTPYKYVVLNYKESDNRSIQKLNKLRQTIEDVTNRYEQFIEDMKTKDKKKEDKFRQDAAVLSNDYSDFYDYIGDILNDWWTNRIKYNLFMANETEIKNKMLRHLDWMNDVKEDMKNKGITVPKDYKKHVRAYVHQHYNDYDWGYDHHRYMPSDNPNWVPKPLPEPYSWNQE